MTKKHGITMDGSLNHGGANKGALKPGLIEKGGSNTMPSQIVARPAPPPPMKPAGSQGQTENQAPAAAGKK